MKGQMLTLEAIIAIVMVVSILLLIFRQPPSTPEFKVANYKLRVYKGLKVLENFDLRKDTLNNDATSIKQDLAIYVPPELNYEVVIYNKTSNLTAVPTIDSEEVATVSYFLAGDVDNYAPREVRVYLWP
jgi:protein-disulfide isomerase